MKKALIVLEKEWLELRLQRGLLLATLFLPPVMTTFGVVVFYVAGKFSANMNTAGAPLPPEFVGLSPLELAQALVGRQFSILFLLLPIFIPSVLASYAIVGEKRERTLEPVLATPIRTWELLLGKTLAALIPALAITIASACLFVVGILSFAVSDRVRELIVTPGWILAVLVDTPLLALIGVALVASERSAHGAAVLGGTRRTGAGAALWSARRGHRPRPRGRARHRRGPRDHRRRRAVGRHAAIPA